MRNHLYVLMGNSLLDDSLVCFIVVLVNAFAQLLCVMSVWSESTGKEMEITCYLISETRVLAEGTTSASYGGHLSAISLEKIIHN